MEKYQYVEGFQRLHTGLRLRCAACLSLQFFVLFEYSRTPLIRTLKGNENLFELAGSIKIFNFLG